MTRRYRCEDIEVTIKLVAERQAINGSIKAPAFGPFEMPFEGIYSIDDTLNDNSINLAFFVEFDELENYWNGFGAFHGRIEMRPGGLEVLTLTWLIVNESNESEASQLTGSRVLEWNMFPITPLN